MARYLDPELRRIIEDASRNVQSSDTLHPSMISHDFNHTPLNRHLGRRQPTGEPSFLANGYQTAHSVLDDFDRSILRSGDVSQHPEPNDSHTRRSLPSNVTYNSPTSTKAVPPSIYGRQINQQQPIDERAYISALRATVVGERQQRPNTTSHEPTAIFHGIDKANVIQSVRQKPATPISLSSYAYNTPAEDTTTPSDLENSSPSTRISLRRKKNQHSALTLPKMVHSSFDDDLMQCTPPSQQDIMSYPAREDTRLDLALNPPTIRGIQLVSPHDLPDRFRQVFPYEIFNAVQSKCFAAIYKTSDNVVVAAPTGSGKTAILELAICKLVQEFGSEQFKIVYQAPTKSLCSERVRDWERKFSHLNLRCAELTGDTNNSEMRKVGSAAIIITTPEKWDSITRKWKDHVKLLQLVKLVLIDEVHILKDPRGATLEAVVSRMKSIGANVRFVALSATVPNSEDIAMWLGKDHTNGHLPAHRETFGEEFRPVKLQKHVYGFSANTNDFAFDSFLDTKLPGLIAKHTIRKPMMVFCVTRKICESTAAKLAEWWSSLRVTDRPWPIPHQKTIVQSPELRQLVGCGVAFHHAGLDAQDRIAVETGFLRNGISVICCTSTLAVGVNLPCHLVVIKNTVCYKDGGLSEYSDLEVMQMLGRAGRPQFDDSAIAIIMTRSEKVDRYKMMISGQDILESTLHLNLIEHLNSEVGLGTVYDIYSAKRWLAGTFLSVRMRKNPTYYKFSSDTGTRDADERLERVCERDIEMLKNTKLITEDERFVCTDYGQAMSKYMVQFETMKLLLSIPKNAKMTQILHIISQSAEFKDLRLKPNERASFREFNKSAFIKSPIRENISNFAHKVSLIIQIHLGGVDLPMNKEFNSIKRQFQSEKLVIFDRVLRLIRCVAECKAYEFDAVATCNALELLRSIAAGFWENSTLQLRQLPTIGPAAVRKLVQSNIKTVVQLASMDSAAIERVMSRNPPFGRKILDCAVNFPRLTLKADMKKKILKPGEPVKVLIKARIAYSNVKFPAWNHKAPPVTFTASISNGNLAHIWRGSIARLEKGFDLNFTCELSCPTDTIICQLACEEIVGTTQSVELSPDIPASEFPPPKPILTPAKALPSQVTAKVVLGAEEEAEIIAALEAEENSEFAAIGSDYGGGSVFDEFVNIDDLDMDATAGNGDPAPLNSEPIQMDNGKWRCNHKCIDAQGNYLTKNGAPCKHICCREGVDKPRKLQKKKTTESNTILKVQKKVNEKNLKSLKKSSKDTPKLKLKLAEDEKSLHDIEELDLVNESLEVESPCVAPRQYLPTPGVLSIGGKPGSIRILKRIPQFSYGSGSQPDLSLIGHFDHDDRSDIDFPSPSVLLGTEDPFGYGHNDELVVSPVSHHEQGETSAEKQEVFQVTESFENSAFDFNAFETFENALQVQSSSSGKKRPASPSFLEREPDIKHHRVVVEEDASDVVERELLPGAEAKPSRPAWVSKFDQDLIAYFGDSVEYEE